MKVFYLALRYWAATIFLVTLFTALWGFFKLSGGTVMLSMIILLMGAIISFPLILPCIALLQVTARLPYSAGGKSWWLAFMLSLLYLLFVLLFRLVLRGMVDNADSDVFFVFSTAAIIIVTWLSRNDLQSFYKQETNRK